MRSCDFFLLLTVVRSVSGDSWSPVEVKDTAGMSMMKGERKDKKEGKKLFLKINKIVVLASIGAHHCLAKLAIAKSTASERMEVSGRLTAKQQIII
jgi:hypothetical protein